MTLRETLISRLISCGYSERGATAMAERLLSIEGDLLDNVKEFALGRPLSDVLVRNKFCLRDVLEFRHSGDIPGCILDLAAYAEDPTKIYRVFRRRA